MSAFVYFASRRAHGPANCPTWQRAFTLIELVVALVLLGILAVAAMPRFGDQAAFNSRGFSDQLVAGLQLARQEAVAQRHSVCATVAASGLTIAQATAFGNACTVAMNNPATGQAYSLPVPSGVSLSGVPVTIIFDAAGRHSGATTTINVVGDITRTITIEAETGYVHSP